MSCNVDTDEMRKHKKRQEKHMQKTNEKLGKIIKLQERLLEIINEEIVKAYKKEGEE